MAEIKPEVLKTLRVESTLQKINQGKRRTHRFDVDFSEYNEKFVGKFQLHHPSNMERLNMGVVKSQLLGGNFNVDIMTDNIATIISTLDCVIDEKPDWFDVYDDELDYDIIEEVYKEYINWKSSFRKRDIKPNNETNSTDGESEV